MAITMGRVRVAWTGATGLPGVSTFYFGDPIDGSSRLQAMFTSISAFLPNAVKLQVASDGDEILDTTGVIQGSWSTSAYSQITSTGGANYAAPTGACIDWLTGTVIGRRRVMGRTFLVPLAGAFIDSDGTINSTAMTGLSAAVATYVTHLGTSTAYVYHRPEGASVGQAVLVTGGRVPDKWCVLRSRRD